MAFFNPVWLALALPLAIPLLYWKAPSRGVLLLRILLLALIVLAMAGLALKLPSRSGTVVVVVDRSHSMPPSSERNIQETLQILQKSCASGNRMGVISFAESSGIEKMPENDVFDSLKATYKGDQSNLTCAVKDALSLIPDGSPGRILLLTDGAWTGESPVADFAQCASRGIPVDYRLFGANKANDLAIKEIFAPHSAPAGEFYMVNAEIKSPSVREVDYTIMRNGKPQMKGRLRLTAGTNRFAFKDCAMTPQTIHYSMELSGVDDDPCKGNNKADFIVQIHGKRPVLLVTMSRNSGLGKILAQSGYNVMVKEPQELDFSLSVLAGYSSIIIENVPASKIGVSGMQTIAELVRKSGTGFLLTGGKNAFGLGGYYKSPLENVLPVTMELRNEHRKLSMAIVLVLDRSGSMSMPARGGRTKMDLADAASVEVLRMMSPNDSIGVIAVDSEPHTIVELMNASSAMGMQNKIMHIQSMGGGIFVYNGLAAAGRMLAGTKAGARHIILFADAADAEQPDKYKELLGKFKLAGITVSVIGLGSEKDSDAEFLRDVAARGGGRCFFTADPYDLPRLFTQDTVVVSRNTFIDEPVKVKINGDLKTVTTRQMGASFSLGGYNLCYLQPKASAGASTLDEYKAPVIAFWQAGLGRVLCFTGEADGEYSGNFAKWEDAGKLFSDITTWLSADKHPLPDGMMITQEIDNGIHKIRLHLDPERKNDPFSNRPAITTLSGLPGQPPQTKDSVMDWESPDIMLANIPLASGETSLSTIKITGFPPQALAPVTLPYSPEYKPLEDDVDRSSLKNMCSLSGGRERSALADIWQELPSKSRLIPVAQWLLVAAMLVLLLEVFERRTGLLFKRFPNIKFTQSKGGKPAGTAPAKTVKKQKKHTASIMESIPEEKEAPQKTEEEAPQHQVLSALSKAKNASKKH